MTNNILTNLKNLKVVACGWKKVEIIALTKELKHFGADLSICQNLDNLTESIKNCECDLLIIRCNLGSCCDVLDLSTKGSLFVGKIDFRKLSESTHWINNVFDFAESITDTEEIVSRLSRIAFLLDEKKNTKNFRPELLSAKPDESQEITESIRGGYVDIELFDTEMVGLAHHKIVTNKAGKPIDYIFISVNKGFEMLTGLNRAHIIGKNVRSIIPDIIKDSTDWIGEFGKVALDNDTLDFESFSAPLNKWYSVHAFCTENEYFITVFTDITKRIAAEEKLSATKERYASLVLNAPSCVSVFKAIKGGKDFEYIMINAQTERVENINKSDTVGKLVTEILPNVKQCGILDSMTKVLQSGETIRMPLVYYKDDRIEGYRDINIYRLSNNDVVTVYRDLTEEIYLQQKNIETELKFKLLVDYASDWEYWIRPDGNYEYISPSCEAISGYPPEKFIEDGDFLFTLIHEDDKNFVIDHFNHSDDPNSHDCILDFRLIDKEGNLHWIEHKCRPIFDKKGKFLGKRSSNRDVTRRKLAEDKMNEYQNNLEKLVEERTHELEEKNKEMDMALKSFVGRELVIRDLQRRLRDKS